MSPHSNPEEGSMTSETMIEEVINDLQFTMDHIGSSLSYERHGHSVLIRQWTDDGVLINEPVARLSLEVLS